MAILKCKMCGGDVELAGDKTFGTCEYCGCTMTFPKVEDEQRAAAFNRGNHFRRIGEFDKALAVYERIVQEDDTDAEAHWCCALCRFGIEYVEDPATMEWIPTCHRASFDSFLEDVDYLAAVEHSDGITQRQYQKDAAKIAEVQRGILAASQNAEPYDVFICYKETDAQGNRTKDSLMAQDIYYQLTEQGRKVFFARITLEDVAGAQYEPYIFAALNSAKVMIVVGTSADHLSAVWVKNEWSRFLSLMKKDHGKLLLPCYRDMDPYDLPEQLSVLQSYDMAKIGFIQDLIRGIAKVLDADKKVAQTTVVKETIVTGGGGTVAPLLKRAFMYLEDGDWSSADEYCEKVLDIDPECAEAYLGKLMASLQVCKRDDLKNQKQSFDNDNNYQKAMRFGDEKLKAELQGYIEQCRETAEANARETQAKAKRKKGRMIVSLVAIVFASLIGIFVVYPFISYQSSNFKPYVQMYRVKEFTIPDGVTEIKAEAFRGCDSLTSVTIPDSVTSMGDDAFEGCYSLESVYISDLAAWCAIEFGIRANPMIEAENLYVNGKLVTDLVIPDSVTAIGDDTFTFCDSLTSVTIPDSVTAIGEHVFDSCDSLTSVTIGDSVTTIGEFAFGQCESLTSVTIGDSVTTIGDYAFAYCESLASVFIPDSVTSIGEHAFYDCTALTSVTIPDSVTTIGDYTFSSCDSLTSVTIPDSVTTIGGGTFYDCDSLALVTIPDSVTSIEWQAFDECDSLTNVHFKGTMSQWENLHVDFTSSVKVHCSDGTIEDA